MGIQQQLDAARAAAAEKARQRAPKPVPAANGSTYTPIAGPGSTPEDNNVLTRLGGINTYRAGFPGYNNEAGFNDRVASYDARGQQKELGDAITDRALGRGGPSVAELQMQRGLGIAQQRLRNQAVSGRGMNRGAAQRAALRGASDMYMQTNEQAGIMRAQEQIAAQQLATQNARDMRQQDLLSRGYSIEEAKAILDAQMRAQEINAGITTANAKNAQGPMAMAAGALGGLFASDARSKEIMYSDFTMKEGMGLRPEPARTDVLQPQPPVRADMGYQPMLQVTPTEELDDSVEKQQQSLGEKAMAAAAGNSGSDLGQQAQTGFDIGSAIGGALGGLSDIRSKELMPSDFTGKEMFRSYGMNKARVGSGKAFDASPERINRMADFELNAEKQKIEETRAKKKAFDRLKYIREGIPNMERYRENLMSSDARRKEQLSHDPKAAVTEIERGLRILSGHPVQVSLGKGQDVPMSSDFRSKEPTMGELDQVGREAMLPFDEMNAAESRQALAPVEPVVYRYKPGPSMRMANEQADMADMRARYAGMGGAQPEEESAIREGTFEDKRTPRLGIVAQDLQQSPAFRQSVVSTPAGLAVQRDRALSTALGSLAGLDKRIRELENLGDSKAAEIRGEPVDVERARRRFKERGGTGQKARGLSEDEFRMFERYAR